MNKRSFFDYLLSNALDAFLRLLSWFSMKIGLHSFLARIANRKSESIASVCWVIFMFTFLLSFLFLFTQRLMLTIVVAIGCGGLVIAYGFPRMREIMLGSLPVRWVVQLLDPNK